MDADSPRGKFIPVGEGQLYLQAIPIHSDGSVVGAVLVVQNSGYIQSRLNEIWKNNLLRLTIQIILLLLAIITMIRWVVYAPLKNLAESLKTTRLGMDADQSPPMTRNSIFQPLIREVSLIRKNLIEARWRAREEARLRIEKFDSPWTEERLKEFVNTTINDRMLVNVSNREPYIHTMVNGSIKYFFPASGMATAIEPLMQACGGTWVAHGSGDADRQAVDAQDRVRVPPDEPKYTLRRVWLSATEEKGYYYGFSNEGLWPLCHNAHVRPMFRTEDYVQYRVVNEKFAATVLSEIEGKQRPIIFVQDYLLALVPQMIKKHRPDAVVVLFWHVPWPTPESFSICPARKDILKGMLGADLIGFHTQQHCNNFIETIGTELESLIDWERFAVTRGNHRTLVKPFPISIGFYTGHRPPSSDQSIQRHSNDIRQEFGITAPFIGLGVDRMDYIKGILERLQAIELFLEKYPEYQEQFVFIQISPHSRSQIEQYKKFEELVDAEVERINKRLGRGTWKPILLFTQRHTHEELWRLYAAANVCLVTSIHDGMNLVAKEFVAARDDERGSLILSQFTGASKELKDAIIVNPYNTEEVADAIKITLTMPSAEQARRMKKMRQVVQNNNVYRWSAEIIRTVVNEF